MRSFRLSILFTLIHSHLLTTKNSACFLIGDGIVTPAISVLSALEGIKTYAPKFSSAIIPLSCVILFLLFMVQRYGTGKVGLTFAPLMVIWFASLFMIGAYQISLEPSIFKAFSPYYILRFMVRLGPYQGFSVWSSVYVLFCCSSCSFNGRLTL